MCKSSMGLFLKGFQNDFLCESEKQNIFETQIFKRFHLSQVD